MGSKGRPYRTIPFAGFEILVGKGDVQNDRLTFEVAGPDDVWLHAAGAPGCHVVVRNPDGLDAMPDAVIQRAAGLAAWYSKAGRRGKTEVHVCRAADVSKPPHFPPGKVLLRRWWGLKVYPLDPSGELADDERKRSARE